MTFKNTAIKGQPRNPLVEEWAETQTKVIQNLFNEIMAENSPSMGKVHEVI
jgi:hypothetical protein